MWSVGWQVHLETYLLHKHLGKERKPSKTSFTTYPTSLQRMQMWFAQWCLRNLCASQVCQPACVHVIHWDHHFSVQRLHGFRQVVTHVQLQQKDELWIMQGRLHVDSLKSAGNGPIHSPVSGAIKFIGIIVPCAACSPTKCWWLVQPAMQRGWAITNLKEGPEVLLILGVRQRNVLVDVVDPTAKFLLCWVPRLLRISWKARKDLRHPVITVDMWKHIEKGTRGAQSMC